MRIPYTMKSSASAFDFQYPLFFLKVIQWLLTSSFSSSRNFNPSLYLLFNNMFYKAVPSQDVNNPISLHSFHRM